MAIKIVVNSSGETKLEGIGYAGASCEKDTRLTKLENKLLRNGGIKQLKYNEKQKNIAK